LDITLQGSHDVGGVFASASCEENDGISVLFGLTEQSVIDLSGFDGGPGPIAGQLLDSHGNVILAIPANVGSISLVLEPGSYQLDASAEGSSGFDSRTRGALRSARNDIMAGSVKRSAPLRPLSEWRAPQRR